MVVFYVYTCIYIYIYIYIYKGNFVNVTHFSNVYRHAIFQVILEKSILPCIFFHSLQCRELKTNCWLATVVSQRNMLIPRLKNLR